MVEDNSVEWLKGLLRQGQVKVTFMKKDGTERTMRCTLHPEYVPQIEEDITKAKRKQSGSNLAVYDLDKQGWRSFIVENVKQVEFVMPDFTG
jgi:hypothetical protein